MQFCIKNDEQGNVKAKIILYDLAKKNVPQALNILIRDAENKIAKAQNKLGEVYLEGVGFRKTILMRIYDLIFLALKEIKRLLKIETV